MSRKIVARVISQEGHCAAGHKVGDMVEFTGDEVRGKICLSAHYSMLPKVFALYYDARFPWIKENQNPKHACPDAANPVVFELAVKD